MNIDQIHWHDCVIVGVFINDEASEVRMRVEYPIDWARNDFALQDIVFLEGFAYKEYEGPFLGRRSIFGASVLNEGRHYVVRMETNAGYREVTCADVRLESPGPEPSLVASSEA